MKRPTFYLCWLVAIVKQANTRNKQLRQGYGHKNMPLRTKTLQADIESERSLQQVSSCALPLLHMSEKTI